MAFYRPDGAQPELDVPDVDHAACGKPGQRWCVYGESRRVCRRMRGLWRVLCRTQRTLAAALRTLRHGPGPCDDARTCLGMFYTQLIETCHGAWWQNLQHVQWHRGVSVLFALCGPPFWVESVFRHGTVYRVAVCTCISFPVRSATRDVMWALRFDMAAEAYAHCFGPSYLGVASYMLPRVPPNKIRALWERTHTHVRTLVLEKRVPWRTAWLALRRWFNFGHDDFCWAVMRFLES